MHVKLGTFLRHIGFEVFTAVTMKMPSSGMWRRVGLVRTKRPTQRHIPEDGILCFQDSFIRYESITYCLSSMCSVHRK
jgi:hypothetical protein